jgi:hypothetical protein
MLTTTAADASRRAQPLKPIINLTAARPIGGIADDAGNGIAPRTPYPNPEMEARMRAELDDLQFHWGEPHEIGFDEPGHQPDLPRGDDARGTPMCSGHTLIDAVTFVGYAALVGKVSWLPPG